MESRKPEDLRIAIHSHDDLGDWQATHLHKSFLEIHKLFQKLISNELINTCVEIVRTITLAILIHCPGPSMELRTRARLFSERQWVDMTDLDELTTDSFVYQGTFTFLS